MRTCILIALLALCGCSRAPAPAPPPEPEVPLVPFEYRDCNLVFVSFDALQAAHVGILGYPRNVTPHLDAFAAQSYRFTNAASVASWTVPASMTWFTGVYPSEHKMTNKFAIYNRSVQKSANLKELSPHLATLADVLRADGYATGGFCGNAGVSGGFGYEQGFDVYSHEQAKFGGFDYSIPRALNWAAANRHRKFFLFLHGYDCHGQNVPAEGYDYRFVDADYDKKFLGTELEQEALREEGLDRGRLALRDADIRFWRAIYDEKISRTDERFRHFLAEFDKLGVTGKTLFVLTSDHGTELFEHGRIDHGFTLYQDQLHVPLFVRLPDQNTGAVVNDRISTIDVMPTILDLLKVNVPENAAKQLRGRSLVPAMKGEPIRRDAFSETDYRAYTHKRSIISPDGWKLIVTLESKSRELYDLNRDPHEATNLAAAEPQRADDLEKRLFAHFQSIGHNLAERRWEVGLNPVYASQAKDPPPK